VQENQRDLGRGYINTWEEMKQVMRRRFVPSSYQRDLRNRLQMLKQGKRSVDEYFKEMELLLVRAGIREDAESTMARFLGGLNEEISGFVEMFPYRTLQDLVDQAMRTEQKIQQESRGKSYGSYSIAAPMAQTAVKYFLWWWTISRRCSQVFSIICSIEDGSLHSVITNNSAATRCKFSSPKQCLGSYIFFSKQRNCMP